MRIRLGDRGSNAKGRRDSFVCSLALGLAGGIVALTSLVIPPTAFSTEAVGKDGVTVYVFNFRQISDKTLTKGKDEAARVFSKASVRLTWRDCPDRTAPCSKGSGRSLSLALVAGPSQSRFVDTVAGYAIPKKGLAVIYYDYLPRISGEHGENDRGSILGCVIAHELGHLLLGPREHSLAGIMLGHWDVDQIQRALMSQLSFLAEEANLMRGNMISGRENEFSGDR